MMKVLVRIGLSMALVTMLSVARAGATTITFDEGLVASGTQLQGNSAYDSYGVTFESSVLFGPDSRLPDDGMGIYNSPSSVGAVNFTTPVTGLGFTWATAGAGESFFLEAFDSSHTLISSFSFDGTLASGSSNGHEILPGTGIARIEYHDGGATVAIDTLSFTAVPEPTTLSLMGIGLAAALRRYRRR